MAPVPLKRTYQVVSKYNPNRRSVKRRVAAVERKIKNFEVKTKNFTYTATIVGGSPPGFASVQVLDLCNIGQGTGDQERVGSEINIVRIEVRGSWSVDLAGNNGKNMTTYLFSPVGTTNPDNTSFVGVVPGAHFNNHIGTELAYHTSPIIQDEAMYMNWKPRFPWKVTYGNITGTSTVRNKILLVLTNFTGGPSQPNYSIRVWYKDD